MKFNGKANAKAEQPDIVERLGATRARIEAAVDGPSVLVVTSAMPSDGCSLLASALAESLMRAGHSVLLILSEAGGALARSVRSEHSGKLPQGERLRLPGGVGEEPPASGLAIVGLAMSGTRDAHSLESIKIAMTGYRQTFAFTIIDAPQALTSGSALSFARAADLVIVAFEEGRSARATDRELAKTLKSMGASVLGVVTLDPKTIARETKKRAPRSLPAKIGTARDDRRGVQSAFSSTIG